MIPLMWYHNKINKRVPLVREELKYYISREDSGYINIIKKEDAIKIN